MHRQPVFAQNRLFANNSGKPSFTNFTGRTQISRIKISRIKILAPWATGTQNGGENGCFVYNELNFFVTEQISMKFRQKTSIGVLY